MLDVNRVLTQVLSGDAGVQNAKPTAKSAHQASEQQNDQSQHFPTDRGTFMDKLVPLGTGALASGLAGRLFGSKRLRDVSGTALQVGAVAAIGGLAYRAYQNYQQGRPVIPESISSALTSVHDTSAGTMQGRITEAWAPLGPQADGRAKLLLSAMVAAAAADGHLDGIEYGRIRSQLLKQGWSEEEQLLLSQLLLRPATIEDLVAEATSFEERVEVYTAARLAVDADTASEHDWLDRLAIALRLDPQLKTHLDATGAQKTAVAA